MSVQANHAPVPQQAWRSTLSGLPESVLPEKGRMLWPHLQSALRFYDLPIQHFAYNKLEVAFSLPEDLQECLLQDDADAEMPQIGSALEFAIRRASGTDDTDSELETLEIELLEALKKLVPLLSGIVTEFKVSGTILEKVDETYRVGRETSKRVKRVLQAVRIKEE
ncbi:hypothetical protein [Marinobacter sp. NSM]|uniref:hypothetical protein n=1 Tax=Marinobacter sp. NSM TaxID=3458004 RepID=UPI004036A6B2